MLGERLTGSPYFLLASRFLIVDFSISLNLVNALRSAEK
jgi:hypothetical protein